MNRIRASEDERPTFEETYPSYEFAPLVTIALTLGGWLAGQRDRVESAPRATTEPLEVPGSAAHAR